MEFNWAVAIGTVMAMVAIVAFMDWAVLRKKPSSYLKMIFEKMNKRTPTAGDVLILEYTKGGTWVAINDE